MPTPPQPNINPRQRNVLIEGDGFSDRVSIDLINNLYQKLTTEDHKISKIYTEKFKSILTILKISMREFLKHVNPMEYRLLM